LETYKELKEKENKTLLTSICRLSVFLVFTYKSRRMKPVEIVLGREEEGERWRR
jgi:hypothetical protein